MKKQTPKTNKEKSRERREAANALAVALGFSSWRRFETAMKNYHADGRRITVTVLQTGKKNREFFST